MKRGKVISEKSRFLFGVILVVIGVVLIFLGFYTPPIGEIHTSVLGATGELLCLGGALIGADSYLEFKMKKMFHSHHIEEIENIENEDITETDVDQVG